MEDRRKPEGDVTGRNGLSDGERDGKPLEAARGEEVDSVLESF